jgi:L-lactate dehydrogenase (cytochrome)
MALKVGADAIIVSNHGGRQLDGAISSIKALPSILDAVGDKVEVHVDGGIRTGQDVLKCLAMGAKGTYIGRAYIYGLGALGEKGVTKTFEILQKEMDVTMAFAAKRIFRMLVRIIYLFLKTLSHSGFKEKKSCENMNQSLFNLNF